ncbi:hypothetical protein Tco_0582042 [Tanacetum coccineum]
MILQVHSPQSYSSMYAAPHLSQPQISLAVPVFTLRDDPIACLNKEMVFMSVVAASRFPSTNNQLRTSSNPRNQVTIQDGREGRQGLLNAIIVKTEDLDAYDSDSDDVSTAQAVLMANLSNYGSDVLLEVGVQDSNLYTQQDSMILSAIEQMSEQIINHVNNWEKANQEKNNESLTAELERYKEGVKTFEQRLNVD